YAKAEAEARAQAEAQAQAEEQARAEAYAKAEAEARAQAEAEEKAREEAQAREEEARREAQALAVKQARTEAQARDEAEAKARAEKEARAEEEARLQAQAHAVALARAEAKAEGAAISETDIAAREMGVQVITNANPEETLLEQTGMDDSTKKSDSESVMVFISPDFENQSGKKDDSTRVSRRQLMPTVEEEHVILSYLEKEGTFITKGEYEQLIKQISAMLVSAPKNAIAIEIKKVDPGPAGGGDVETLELCYHISVRNDVSQACFKYFEFVGKRV
ncbi:MAG: hypothetical protein GY757_57300, partial [bacterium]|nr:hypothetical protein [bacterium]